MLAQRRKKVITEYFKWGQSLTRLLATLRVHTFQQSRKN
jgi:hypothetical protein